MANELCHVRTQKGVGNLHTVVPLSPVQLRSLNLLRHSSDIIH